MCTVFRVECSPQQGMKTRSGIEKRVGVKPGEYVLAGKTQCEKSET